MKRAGKKDASTESKRPRKKGETVDEFTRIENTHLKSRCETKWKDAARARTCLPVIHKDGKVGVEVATSHDYALEGEDSFGTKSEKVNVHDKLGYKECAGSLSIPQREILTKQDAALANLDLVSFLVKADEIGKQIILDPVANLFLLESVMTRLSMYQKAYSSCENLAELEDLCKQYIVLFVTVGKIFVHSLPHSVVVLDTENTGGKKKMSRYYDLLSVHLWEKWVSRHLRKITVNDNYICTKPEIITHVCHVVAELLPTARNFNVRNEFLDCYILLLAKTDSNQLFESLATALEQDVTLNLAAVLIPKIVKRAYNQNNKKETSYKKGYKAPVQDQSGHVKVIGRTIRLCDYLHIDRKERNALNEVSRKGLDEKLLLKDRKSMVDKRAQHDIALGLVSGDFKKFQENKKVILESMIELFIRVLRGPTNYSLECVYETLRSLGKQAVHINIEMSREMFVELRKLATDVFNTKKYNDVSASLALAACVASIELMSQSSKNSEVYVETDTQWVIPVVARALYVIFPHLSLTRKQTKVQDTSSRGIQADNLEALTIDDVLHVLEKITQSNKALGSLGETFSHLAKCPKATELFSAMQTISCLTSDGVLRQGLAPLCQTLLKKYPTIKSTFDEEGLVLDSLSPPQTVAWCNHLSATSVFTL